jgi:hypothetical protein
VHFIRFGICKLCTRAPLILMNKEQWNFTHYLQGLYLKTLSRGYGPYVLGKGWPDSTVEVFLYNIRFTISCIFLPKFYSLLFIVMHHFITRLSPQT